MSDITETEKIEQARIKEQDRNRRWEMAYKARIRQIVPGLCLGNVQASHHKETLLRNHINAMVSLTDAHWTWWRSTTRSAGIPEDRHKWVQCVDSSTQNLLVHMSDICDFIDQMACPALSSLSSLHVQPEQDADTHTATNANDRSSDANAPPKLY
ncbi:dual specificity phosphatase Yvh1 [Penicillium angulare]|uniref:Dual specificity phosphatase Yvh1 n=1 Tax=Penicillium angulare TaxID=116970 RepID=A0A9W9FHD4_9EURO|nr:dual specificity phosphatase Yvh1 [Penicillium angulare]